MVMVMAMMLNATFNNISAISWQSVLLVEETKASIENTKLLQQDVLKGKLFFICQTLNDNLDCDDVGTVMFLFHWVKYLVFISLGNLSISPTSK